MKNSLDDLRNRMAVDDVGCWIWTGAVKPGRTYSYGSVNFCGRSTSAHRAAWVIANGDIPAGMFVCHKCDKPLCVNPSHLFLGTHADNMQDMWNKRRHPSPTDGVTGSLSSKLTIEDVKAIRELLAQGHKQKDIASRFSVAQTAISAIKIGRNWGRYAQ